MKKIFAAVFSMALVFGLAGCGSQSSQSSDSAATQVEGLTDEGSVARARDLMENLFANEGHDNFTEVDTVTTSTEENGETMQNVVVTTKMIDTSKEPIEFYLSTKTQPEAQTDATYYINGKNGILEMEGQRVSIEVTDQYLDKVTNPQDKDSSYQVYYEDADEISYYQNDDFEVVQIQVNPEKLMESGILPDFSNIESCVAEYSFTKDGELYTFLNTVKGTIKGDDGSDVEVTIDTKCLFTDYGTTQVPELPEPDNAADEGTDQNSEATNEG